MLAFIVAWPTSWNDFWRRLAVSLICGFAFSPVLSNRMGWPDEPRFVVAATIACSIFAWAAIATGMRILKGMNQLPKE